VPSCKATDVRIRIAYAHQAPDFIGRNPRHIPERTIKLISQNKVLHDRIKQKLKHDNILKFQSL
jgi:hypothetical protein